MGENREYLTQSASDGSINISEDVVVAIASRPSARSRASAP